MIIVIGTATVDPASLGEMKGAMADMMAATRKEPGCLHYSMAVEDAEAGLVSIAERWENIESLGAHGKAPHMATFQKAAAGKILGMEIAMYDAANERPIAL